MRIPPPEQQARFARNLQRLLTEGEFVSTYKFALLLSLARWATENPDYDEQQPLDVRAIAAHFGELYWPHVRPFATPSPSTVAERPPAYAEPAEASWLGVLVQDRGQRSGHQVPRVLKQIRLAQQETGAARLHELPERARGALLADVRRSIAEMPLPRLQRVRDSDAPMSFLYRVGPSRHEIVFEPGIVACLVFFAPLVEDAVRAAWLRFVLRCNPHLLGASSDVESFLFPDARAGLPAWRAPLQAVQRGACFYCGGEIRGTPVVDHFLPWARYPRDLGHNFVLAHAECNQDKSDHLASCEHLARWQQRNEEHGPALAREFDAARLPHDWPTLRRVAGSLYLLAESNGARTWQGRRQLVALDPGWRRILGVA